MSSHSPSALVLGFLALAACGGRTEEGTDVVVDDNESALSGVENAGSAGTGSESAGAEDDGPADDGCRDGDRDGHHHHHRHWFKILDRLDGAKDGTIVIASLPAGLPDRLIAKLHRVDKNDDGIVTKKEAKRARRHHHRAESGDDERDERDDD